MTRRIPWSASRMWLARRASARRTLRIIGGRAAVAAVAAVLGGAVLPALQVSQPPIRILDPTNPSPGPGDARMNQFEDPEGASWRCFAVDSLAEAPVRIVRVGEVRQFNPPSAWSVSLRNDGLLPANTVTVAAAVVDVHGNVKAIQPLPEIRNLKPGQLQRREARIRVTVIAPTDRVVFYLREVAGEAGHWRASESELAGLIRTAAQRLPVP